MKRITSLFIMLAMAVLANAQGEMSVFGRVFDGEYIVYTDNMIQTSGNG